MWITKYQFQCCGELSMHIASTFSNYWYHIYNILYRYPLKFMRNNHSEEVLQFVLANPWFHHIYAYHMINDPPNASCCIFHSVLKRSPRTSAWRNCISIIYSLFVAVNLLVTGLLHLVRMIAFLFSIEGHAGSVTSPWIPCYLWVLDPGNLMFNQGCVSI